MFGIWVVEEAPLSPCVEVNFCYNKPNRWSVSLGLAPPAMRSSLRCESVNSIYTHFQLLEVSSIHEIDTSSAEHSIFEATSVALEWRIYVMVCSLSAVRVIFFISFFFRENTVSSTQNFPLTFWFQGFFTFGSPSWKCLNSVHSSTTANQQLVVHPKLNLEGQDKAVLTWHNRALRKTTMKTETMQSNLENLSNLKNQWEGCLGGSAG